MMFNGKICFKDVSNKFSFQHRSECNKIFVCYGGWAKHQGLSSARDIMKSWPTAGILGKYRSEKLSKIHFIFFYLKVH